jgi:uncharacterized protein
MSNFTLYLQDPNTKQDHKLYYDNQTSELRNESGEFVVEVDPNKFKDYKAVPTVSEQTPGGKSTLPKIVKIQMGLSCNYSCEYCSQRFVPRADETSAEFVDEFMSSLTSWFKPPEHGLGRKIEFWGGEPLLYAKTFKPLAERIRAAYPHIRMSVITNGSLLTKEWVDWLYDLGFSMAISHDGPGQAVRGPDPLTLPKKKEIWLYLYKKMAPEGRMSFNPMLNRLNTSRVAAADFFRELTGDPDIKLGEGGMVDAYDEGGKSMSLRPEEYQTFANQAFAEMHNSDIVRNFDLMQMRIKGWFSSWKTLQPARVIGQKCSMDREDQIAVDLRGNVLTCQNVSAVATAGNGQSHKIGHMLDMDNVKLNTSTHWKHREECSSCPVLQGCMGSCMFLQGELFEVSCNNSYFDHVAFFAEALYLATGLLLINIVGDIRPERQDPFGLRPVELIPA